MFHRNRQDALRAALFVGALGCLSLASCAPPLLSPDENRTPYDNYDSLRNQHADQYIFDEFGTRHPNLKDRLSPKD